MLNLVLLHQQFLSILIHFCRPPFYAAPSPPTHTRTKLFGTEDYVFHDRRVLCNYQMREEETERQIFGLMCRGRRLWSFAGSQYSFVGSLQSLVDASQSFMVVCGRLLLVCGRLLVVCCRLQFLWQFVFVSCLSNYNK